MELMVNLSYTMATRLHQKSYLSLPLIASVNMHLKLPSKWDAVSRNMPVFLLWYWYIHIDIHQLITRCSVVAAECYRWLALSVGTTDFDPPQDLQPLTNCQKLSWVILSAAPTAIPNLVQINPWGFWANRWNVTIILFIYLCPPFWNSPGQTSWPYFMFNGSNDADSHTDVPF